jgi:hypothetical protein
VPERANRANTSDQLTSGMAHYFLKVS